METARQQDQTAFNTALCGSASSLTHSVLPLDFEGYTQPAFADCWSAAILLKAGM